MSDMPTEYRKYEVLCLGDVPQRLIRENSIGLSSHKIGQFDLEGNIYPNLEWLVENIRVGEGEALLMSKTNCYSARLVESGVTAPVSDSLKKTLFHVFMRQRGYERTLSMLKWARRKA